MTAIDMNFICLAVLWKKVDYRDDKQAKTEKCCAFPRWSAIQISPLVGQIITFHVKSDSMT